METEDLYNKLRVECHNKSYDCTAMEYVFEKRAEKLKKRINLINTLGVGVPAVFGFTAIGYGLENPILKLLLPIAIATSIFQFFISLYGLFGKWDDELSYAYEAIQSYNPLFKQYHDLANYPPETYDELRSKFDLIAKANYFRDQQNSYHNIKEWENRMGMRYSLREHQCQCIGCKSIPLSIKSTNCDVCGKFSLKYKTFNL